MYKTHCKLYDTVRRTMYGEYRTMYASLRRPHMYNVQLCNVHYTLYNVHCTLYIQRMYSQRLFWEIDYLKILQVTEFSQKV